MGILQARILEWVAMPSSRGSSQPRDRNQVSNIEGGFFTIWAIREAPETDKSFLKPETPPTQKVIRLDIYMEGRGQKQWSDILLLNKGRHEPPRREVGCSRSPRALPPPGFSLALPSVQMPGQRLQILPGPMCVTPGGAWELLPHNPPS